MRQVLDGLSRHGDPGARERDRPGVFDTVVRRLRKHGHGLQHLPRAVRVLERNLRGLFASAKETDAVDGMLEEAIERTIEPTTWLVVTGWSSTEAERNLLAS